MPAGTKPGYTIGKDDSGWTAREREVYELVRDGKNGAQIAAALGVTKQRIAQILTSLVNGGALKKHGHSYVVVDE